MEMYKWVKYDQIITNPTYSWQQRIMIAWMDNALIKLK